MKNIGIIGGGIVGLCSAYYLRKAGHQVTLYEAGEFPSACSLGNAGMIVPSHIIPLAAPGMIAKGIKWMFDSTSPFYIKPRLRFDLLRWGYHFYKSATHSKVLISAEALKNLSLLSKQLYHDLSAELPFDFGYHERGLLMLYQTKETEKEESETAGMANQFGIEARILSGEEVQALEPDVEVSVRGGVYFPGDAHLTPQVFVSKLMHHLQSLGVNFVSRTPITGISKEGSTVKALVSAGKKFAVDDVIVAAGSWSEELSKLFHLTVPVQAGKGYSFNLHNLSMNTRIPSIFLEARVAVTPMGTSLRFGGTMEISGIRDGINMNRVRGIVDAIPRYYPDMKIEMPDKTDVWYGLRPCSPDGLPYIGRSAKNKNVLFATGHGMMGISLAPATGKLITELINETAPSIGVEAFNPERFN